VKLSLRKLRLKGAWLLVLPFLWFATPTPRMLAVGGVVAALGLLVRTLSAGFIHKDDTLTTTGPYAHTRNPLYLGSFLLGLGVTLAGGNWLFVGIFLVFFTLVYAASIRSEAAFLADRYGDAYADYADNVPLFLPRPTPYRATGVNTRPRFSPAQWRKNREYEALLGTVAAFAALVARMTFGG
jgi:protein-S-isoprenylcysteine O-methyltransferase Ste14